MDKDIIKLVEAIKLLSEIVDKLADRIYKLEEVKG